MLYHGNIVQIAAIDLNGVLLEEGPSRLEADGDSREVEVIKTANPQWDGVLTAWLSQQFQTWAEIIHPLAPKHASFKWFLTVLSCSHLSWWVHFWGGGLLAQRQRLRARLPDILWFWFWAPVLTAVGMVSMVRWVYWSGSIQPMPRVHSLCAKSAQTLCIVWW